MCVFILKCLIVYVYTVKRLLISGTYSLVITIGFIFYTFYFYIIYCCAASCVLMMMMNENIHGYTDSF